MAIRRNRSSIRGTTPEIEAAARSLRRNPTPAEAVLWNSLRKQQLAGLRFRRQHPVGRFVLDFCCPAAKLVIEVDGEVHARQAERDEERAAVLRSAGYQILRFRNDEVMGDLPSVLERIVRAANRRCDP